MHHSPVSSTQTGASITTVGRHVLPLCCPPSDAELWRLHPRIYLPIRPGEYTVCPYCGARYPVES